MRAGLKAFPTDQLSEDFNDKLFARIYSAPRTEATKISNVPSAFVYRLRWLTPVVTALTVIFIAVLIGYNQFSAPDAPPIKYAETEHQMIRNINQTAPDNSYANSYPFSAGNLSFSAAKLESLQVAASLKDNRLMFNRLRLDATRNFGGFGNYTNLRPIMLDNYENQPRLIYPVVNTASTTKQPY